MPVRKHGPFPVTVFFVGNRLCVYAGEGIILCNVYVLICIFTVTYKKCWQRWRKDECDATDFISAAILPLTKVITQEQNCFCPLRIGHVK